MRRGDIRWYESSNPDNKCPVVILTRDSVHDYLCEVTVAPITSTKRDIPSEVPLARRDGLRRDCAVNLDHIQTVDKSRIGARITTLSKTKLAELAEAMRFALDV